MSMDMQLPFKPGDRVIAGVDGPMATVIECEVRAERLDGIHFVVEYDRPRKQSASCAFWFSPIPPRAHLIRLVSFNPHITPSRRIGLQGSHPLQAKPASTPATGHPLAAPLHACPSAGTGFAHTPAAQGAARPAPLSHMRELLQPSDTPVVIIDVKDCSQPKAETE